MKYNKFQRVALTSACLLLGAYGPFSQAETLDNESLEVSPELEQPRPLMVNG